MNEIDGAPGTIRTSDGRTLYYSADRLSEGTSRGNRRGANGRTNREIWIAYSIAVKTDKNGFIEIFQYGGGGRTRTCEVIRRLIYSQLPLPLGTLPRSTALDRPDRPVTDRPWSGRPLVGPGYGARSAALWAKQAAKVNQQKPLILNLVEPKMPLSETRDTSLR
jgi:hypothetical protein